MKARNTILAGLLMILTLSAHAGAQARKMTRSQHAHTKYPIVIYPGYSSQLCRSPSGEDKCYEVPSQFISEFAENKNCVGLTLRVVNSTQPDKWPHWWLTLLAADNHPYWVVRISLMLGNDALDLPPYIGDVVGPDEISHELDEDLTSASPAPMREMVGKTCALANGAIKGGTVEQ
jgi:hypothetical protein